MPIRVTIDYRGSFFARNPVGRLHQNIYRVQEVAGEEALAVAQAQLYPGHGYLSGDLFSSLAYRSLRAYRGGSFTGRGRLVTGRWGYEPVRRYARRQEARYHFMRTARRRLRAWVGSNVGRIARMLIEDLA